MSEDAEDKKTSDEVEGKKDSKPEDEQESPIGKTEWFRRKKKKPVDDWSKYATKGYAEDAGL